MYETKAVNSIVYIDIQKKLWRKPTIFADCTCTPFKPKTFHTIFFDPPHYWGSKPGRFYTFPNLTPKQMKTMKLKGNVYCGVEIYKTRSALIKFIYNAQKEFLRILRDDGLLWLKWSELEIPLNNILAIFKNWRILLKLPIQKPQHNIGEAQTYWVCMCKKQGYQTELTSFGGEK